MNNLFFKTISLCLLLLCSNITYADRIRDLTTVQGLQENQLIGYGLIVGLDGTGDETRQSPIASQSMAKMLSKLGITTSLESNNMRLQNIASVMVTATIPSFSHKGQKIDVLVSSLGNAKSLNGGTLLMTPLKGIDNKIYAMAQGNIVIHDTTYLQPKNIFFKQLQHFNGGIINQGAIIESELKTDFGKHGIINLQLNEEDFSMSQRISDKINLYYPDTAIPLDARTVQLTTTENRAVQIRMLANIQNIEINIPIQDAKVVVNSKTGSIVINHDVQLGNCAIAHGKLSVVIEKKEISLHNFDDLLLNQDQISKKKQPLISINKTVQLRNDNNLNNIIQALTTLGAQPTELMSILQSMKDAGCLHAKLEII
ncbi:Flagellar P-ring protein [Buchnera aphidicola (Eriosoma lanigerum)]|uniref:flagellar basal body P-ring protein FlgI n=1 Tax=Buchnera aphidicola TaxID=9 RepID=UPI00346496DD